MAKAELVVKLEGLPEVKAYLDGLRDLVTTIEKIHQPVDEEAEFWAESGRDDGAEHDRRFPDCPGGDRCEGHTATIHVCTECGYEHDGETPIYRAWPCPTIRAITRLVTSAQPEQPDDSGAPST